MKLTFQIIIVQSS